VADQAPATPKPDPDATTTAIVQKVSPYLRPDKKAEGERVLAGMVAKFHHGPLPPPEDLAHYNAIVPGAAERILAMAEGNLVHRQTLESNALGADIKIKTRGQWYALLALVAMLLVITAAILWAQPWVAGVLGSGTLVTVVAMFLAQNPTEKPAAAAPPARSNKRKK
jgi:uncharacterized membrane protein